jgi:DNA-binding PadR family transcriptional regulator
MSGSEMMEQLFDYTGYRPSPGSVYPLLAQLQEEGLVEQSPDEDSSLKRYRLTEAGREELLDMMTHDDQMQKRQKVIRKIYWRLHRDLHEDLYKSLSKLLDVFEELPPGLLESPGKRAELIDILDEATLGIKSLGVDAS